MAMSPFGAAFSTGLRSSAARSHEQRQFGQTLQVQEQEKRQEQAQKLRQENLKIIQQLGEQLSKIRATQGPEGVQKHMGILQRVIPNLSFGSGIPPDQLAQQLMLAAETGATGEELGTQAGAQAKAAAPGEAAAITAKTPAEAARAAATAGATTRATETVKNALNPTATSYFNPKTQEVISVNEGDPAQMRLAQQGGFVKAPVSVQASSLGGLNQLDKKAMGDVETSLVNLSGRLQRVSEIRQTMSDPAFLTFKGKFQAGSLAMAEKMGAKLSPENKQFLTDFTNAKRAAASDLNQTLKDRSGGAITPQEADRLLLELANFGEDSPTEFLTKVDSIEKSLKLAQARLFHIQQTRGISLTKDQLDQALSSTSLESMSRLMKQEAAKIETQVRAELPNAPESELFNEIRRRLGEKFGLVTQ